MDANERKGHEMTTEQQIAENTRKLDHAASEYAEIQSRESYTGRAADLARLRGEMRIYEDRLARLDYFGEMRKRRPQWNVDRERSAQARAAGVTVERYKSRPENAPASPPNSGGTWPTGFAGTGWVVRDATTGVPVFAAAFRVECLDYVARAASAKQ